ncbi:unnamed protein product, partial [Ectocarpus sp. 12 AP-2014]
MPVEKNRFRRQPTPDVWVSSDVVTSGPPFSGCRVFHVWRRSRVRCPVPGVRCPDISIPDCCLALCVPCVVVFLRSSSGLATPVFSNSFQHRNAGTGGS